MTMTGQMIEMPHSCPACSRCGELTRIYGVEPHSGTPRTEIFTYVCDACEVTEVRIAPTASLQ